MSSFLEPRAWLLGLIRAIIRPRPVQRLWKWLDGHVRIPESSGSRDPGLLRTSRFAIFRGLYDLAQQRHVHFLTVCSSARAGKTLFCICLVLYWIAERFGPVAWLDPTRNSARKLVRDELDDFLLGCEPVRKLAVAPPGTPGSKTLWTTLEKHFRGKRFRIVGSGAEADLHGFNAELAIGNELDACRSSTDSDSASFQKILARTKLYADTRLVVANSTPQKGECGPTWTRFLSATQHYCYLPCPHCSSAKAAELNQESTKAGKQTEAGGGGSSVPDSFVLPAEEDCAPGWSALSYDPRLAGWQRFSFFIEKKKVPFDENLDPLRDESGKLLPPSQWREETTGQASFERFGVFEERPRLDDPTQTERVRIGWNLRRVRKLTTYECAYCKKEIEETDRNWMLPRYRWVAHNPEPDPATVGDDDDPDDQAPDCDPEEHISAHVWSWYSPYERWGVIAREFLEAKGDLGKLLTFWVYTLGKPLPDYSVALKETDIERAIGRCPVRYVKGTMPFEAEMLTMTIDRQAAERWYVIRAWGILWDHPDRPTWSALVDWGELASDSQIEEKAGHKPDPSGRTRKFTFTRPDGTVREYTVIAGLYDCGFEQESVWNYCLTTDWLDPSKGGGPEKTGNNPIRVNEGIMDGKLDLVWFWSDHFAADLYYSCILFGNTHGTPIHWWLPVNVDKTYKDHLTDERRLEVNGKKVWTRRVKNDLGDCEKNQRVLSGTVEERLDEIREERAEAEAKAKAAKK